LLRHAGAGDRSAEESQLEAGFAGRLFLFVQNARLTVIPGVAEHLFFDIEISDRSVSKRPAKKCPVPKVSGTFCAKHPKGEFLAKGTGHFFAARS